jgi:hypothetical protein
MVANQRQGEQQRRAAACSTRWSRAHDRSSPYDPAMLAPAGGAAGRTSGTAERVPWTDLGLVAVVAAMTVGDLCRGRLAADPPRLGT